MTPGMDETQTDPAHYSILVVDDMEANRAMLARRLEKFGYSVSSVETGAQALAFIEKNRPDILLLDYMMPQMNGVEVLERIRAGRVETAGIPVIIVTARTEGEAAIEALTAGADDYVTKPVNFEVLHARIKSQLSRYSGTDRLRRMNAVLDERMTLRNMALADLESELVEETRRRRELEGQLADSPRAPPRPIAENGVDLRGLIAQIAQRLDTAYGNAINGRPVNVAQLVEIKALLAEAADAAEACCSFEE